MPTSQIFIALSEGNISEESDEDSYEDEPEENIDLEK